MGRVTSDEGEIKHAHVIIIYILFLNTYLFVIFLINTKYNIDDD